MCVTLRQRGLGVLCDGLTRYGLDTTVPIGPRCVHRSIGVNKVSCDECWTSDERDGPNICSIALLPRYHKREKERPRLLYHCKPERKRRRESLEILNCFTLCVCVD